MDCEDFKCPICLEILIDPHILRCGHTFCLLCVDEAVNITDRCPMCRVKTQGIIIPNRIAESAIEALITKDQRLLEVHDQRRAQHKETLFLMKKARVVIFSVLNSNPGRMYSLDEIEDEYTTITSTSDKFSPGLILQMESFIRCQENSLLSVAWLEDGSVLASLPQRPPEESNN